MKTLALILGWFVIVMLFIVLSIVAVAALCELFDRIKAKFKK